MVKVVLFQSSLWKTCLDLDGKEVMPMISNPGTVLFSKTLPYQVRLFGNQAHKVTRRSLGPSLTNSFLEKQTLPDPSSGFLRV